jgi:hypothetical protein
MKYMRLFFVALVLFVLALGVEGCRILAPAPAPTRARARTATRLPRPSFTPFVTETPAPLPTEQPATLTPPPPPTAVPPPTEPVTVPTAAPAPPPTDPPPAETPTAVAPALPPQPPREGGSWDFENGFFARASGFEGRVDIVGVEWDYFRHRGENGQGTFNENKYLGNVRRGEHSQEIAFEASDGDAGLVRTIEVIPNHRYLISAWGIHYPSPTPIDLDLGIDLTGGLDSLADTVDWYAWNETGEGRWVYTEETVRATGAQMTIYLRVTHRVAAPGGATLLDDVRVQDLGE